MERDTKSKFFLPILILAVILLISAVILAVLLKKQTDTKNDFKLQTETLSAALSSTEEGKKALEAANKQLDQKATDAEQKATDAKEEANDANAKLTTAQKELNAKLAEVAKVNNDLKAKQADLDKAKRGIAKFSELKTLFGKYDEDAAAFITVMNECYQAAFDGDEATAQSKLTEMETISDRLVSEGESISNLFDTIEKGNY